MIRIEPGAWAAMVAHARQAYPDECCGAMLGAVEDGRKVVREALPLENVFEGARGARYQMRPEEPIEAGAAAQSRGMDLIGFYHSHPDCDARFSEIDLKNSWPWYSFVVLSIRSGELHHASSWRPNLDQTEAVEETLTY